MQRLARRALARHIAMYAAKRAGKRRYVVFRGDHHADLARRFPSPGTLDADRVTWFERSEEQRNDRLLRAEGAIMPVFQPIVELGSGEVAGYEALARFPQTRTRARPTCGSRRRIAVGSASSSRPARWLRHSRGARTRRRATCR